MKASVRVKNVPRGGTLTFADLTLLTLYSILQLILYTMGGQIFSTKGNVFNFCTALRLQQKLALLPISVFYSVVLL